MNTEALFLFLILLLGLVLCSFLGGKCNKESFTGSFNGKFSVQPDNQMNDNNTNGNSSGTSNTSSNSAGNNKNSNNYDNYNHYSGKSSQLTNGATFYGENGGSVQVNMQSDGTPTLKVTLSKGQQPVIFSTSQSNSSNSNSNSNSNSSSMMNSLNSIFGNSSSSSTTENYTNFNSSKSESVNLQFYGPNGETALVINYQGQKAIQVNTNRGSYIYTMNNPVSSNQSASNPFNSNYTHYNNTPSTYYGSTGVTGANVNNSNLAYNNSSSTSSSSTMIPSQPQSSMTSSSSSYDYSNSLPPGIPKSMIPPGHEDLYILKSEIVPPVCPACPASAACPRQEPCPPCPACARCPEPAFECKKVPNYNSINNDYLPVPVVNDFSSFGM